jgi:hypothetical protein
MRIDDSDALLISDAYSENYTMQLKKKQWPMYKIIIITIFGNTLLTKIPIDRQILCHVHFINIFMHARVLDKIDQSFFKLFVWFQRYNMLQTAEIKHSSKWSSMYTVRILRQFVFTCVRWSITISFSRAGQVMGPADAYAILLLAPPSTTNRSLTIHVIIQERKHILLTWPLR